jgi:hypothetical protein
MRKVVKLFIESTTLFLESDWSVKQNWKLIQLITCYDCIYLIDEKISCDFVDFNNCSIFADFQAVVEGVTVVTSMEKTLWVSNFPWNRQLSQLEQFSPCFWSSSKVQMYQRFDLSKPSIFSHLASCTNEVHSKKPRLLTISMDEGISIQQGESIAKIHHPSADDSRMKKEFHWVMCILRNNISGPESAGWTVRPICVAGIATEEGRRVCQQRSHNDYNIDDRELNRTLKFPISEDNEKVDSDSYEFSHISGIESEMHFNTEVHSGTPSWLRLVSRWVFSRRPHNLKANPIEVLNQA